MELFHDALLDLYVNKHYSWRSTTQYYTFDVLKVYGFIKYRIQY